MAEANGKINFIHNFVSGAAAGAGQIVVGYPFDTVKGVIKVFDIYFFYHIRNFSTVDLLFLVKMQVGSTVAGSTVKAPTGPWDCLKSILRQEV